MCLAAGIPSFKCDFCWDGGPPSGQRLHSTGECILLISLSLRVKDLRESQNVLVDPFGCMELFLKRLETYIEVQPTAAMMDIIVKIMVEVLSILGIVTKEIGQGRMSTPFPVDIQ
jgi:hypothetical protein